MKNKFLIFLLISIPFFYGANFQNLKGQNNQNVDSSFGQGSGYVTTQNSQGMYINRIRIQSDGKIVAVGYTQNPNTQAIIVRYNTNGTIDTTFGTNGIITANIGSTLSTTELRNIAIQSNGNIVVAGYTADVNSKCMALIARYTSAGALDTTFNSPNGYITAVAGEGSLINSVMIQSNGNIIVSGVAVFGGYSNALITRYTSAGVIDSTFGTGGVVTAIVGAGTSITSSALDSSGNILIAGNYKSTLGEQIILARYTSAGALDTTFNSPNGYVTSLIGNRSVANSIAIDSSGNILVAGFANVANADQFVIERYTSAGVLDTTFNSPTGYITSLAGNASRANDIAIQSTDGKIVIGGYINYFIDEATIARFNTNGTSDTTFGNGGVISLAIGNGSRINGIAIQSSDGRTVVGGYEKDPSTNEQFGLVSRFNKNNTDYIVISSIASTISTKIPAVTGYASLTGATVSVLVNGTLFATGTTDPVTTGWNIGNTSVLPVGTNTILANLSLTGATIVGDEIEFTVVDNLGEDSVLVYSTATQTLTGANTATNITFNNAPILNTWQSNGTNTLTCKKAGKYLITYYILGNNTSAVTSATITARITQNGTEIAGSQTGEILAASDFKLLTSGVIVNANANDTIVFQFAGSATTVQLAPTGIGSTLVSAKASIIRLS